MEHTNGWIIRSKYHDRLEDYSPAKTIKRKKFIDELNRIDWYYQTGGTYETAIKWFAKKIDAKPPENLDYYLDYSLGSFVHNTNRPRELFIYISNFSYTTISHEIQHATDYMVHKIMNIDMSNLNEFAPEYASWLMSKFLEMNK